MSNETCEFAGATRQASTGVISPSLPSAYSERRPPPPSPSLRNVVFQWCVTERPGTEGLVWIAMMQRSSVTPLGTDGCHQRSWPAAGTVYGVDFTTRSGGRL